MLDLSGKFPKGAAESRLIHRTWSEFALESSQSLTSGVDIFPLDDLENERDPGNDDRAVFFAYSLNPFKKDHGSIQ